MGTQVKDGLLLREQGGKGDDGEFKAICEAWRLQLGAN